MKESQIYCCYSKPLRDFLIDNGYQPEFKAKNCDNNKTMWIFIKSQEFNRLLKQWTLNRPKD